MSSNMGMFCYQCQETAGGKGCTKVGVCGKNADVAILQDLLIYAVKGLSQVVYDGKIDVKGINTINKEAVKALFMTITNANFDDAVIEAEIKTIIGYRNQLLKQLAELDDGSCPIKLSDAATFDAATREDMLAKGISVGVLSTENEDIRSLRELIIYGIKGLAAYDEHAANLGFEDEEIYSFIYEALRKTMDDSLGVAELIDLTMRTGEFGVKTMALLDSANTSVYGNPEITKVNIGTGKRPAILISGHDLKDLEMLLEQTKNSGVDVYTHGEMLPAHYYPLFKKYDNLVGNYGNAWWKQLTEFESFNGPILFTTNCIVPPRSEAVKNRIFTTGAAGFPGCRHIEGDSNGNKDFSEIIELAKKLPAPTQIESGEIIGGFAHNQVISLADKIVEAIKSGAIKKFFVMGGCDGRMKSRDYYEDFAKKLPEDCIILTAGCAKYRYNKLNLGDINGIPRVLDAGQCNDSYSLAVIALKLKEVFEKDDINELPIAYNIAWYEQKAVIVLLALLYLGVKNIHLGPTLPGFLSPNVADVLVEKFGIAGITDVDSDIAALL